MHELVIVGNGMVGQRLVEAVRERDTRRRWRITVLGEERRPAYDRVNLSALFDGATPADLDLAGDAVGYTRHLDDAVASIDRASRAVTTVRGRTVGYDALVLATGSYPFVPPVPGRDLPGCFVYRTIDDMDAIRAAGAAAPTRGRRHRAVAAS